MKIDDFKQEAIIIPLANKEIESLRIETSKEKDLINVKNSLLVLDINENKIQNEFTIKEKIEDDKKQEDFNKNKIKNQNDKINVKEKFSKIPMIIKNEEKENKNFNFLDKLEKFGIMFLLIYYILIYF